MATFAKLENALKRAKGNIFCNYYVALVMVRDNLRKLCFFRPVIRMIKIVRNIDNNKIVPGINMKFIWLLNYQTSLT
ncbi:hypothetical protein RDI58_010748 [Solanum bulbocastanum]|uniref:Uncharacterized protein n=1 Tax=Solanum bulbocastanum TaxID=147425 RepID=A0AAN8YGM7_SOLBU